MTTTLFLLLLLVTGLNDSPGLTEFEKRLDAYKELHSKVDDAIDPVDETANKQLIAAQREQFAKAIREARPNARPGDLFTKSAAPELKNIIKKTLAGPGGTRMRSTILGEGNPKSKESTVSPALKVNAVYPTGAPVSTMPPPLLIALPELPEALEYRFVGRHLILRDVKADLIVDILFEAVR